ncbi:MAG: FHA domain-containing protein [Prevotella sp.]|jgi:predicted RNA-binding Zn-ribbon protein involved in translation (DUF1610 family)|uniref:FHA domain-containing protein n=1 Tax=Segatella cerevisiae TaxID=2053716 RepID=A0ABT1BW88_9BACT|nr:FHA domain-containing protein [Segatella cerevisiae]MCI1246810.1 FHA domain-containing protein [Prevotella sp.]MCO6025350.1 FHA domain-containing protein [Segatella cerevisiae]
MKRVRCPRCEQYITFDEGKYQDAEKLIFVCPHCGKRFGIRLGISKTSPKTGNAPKENYGAILVIENRFHYKQVIPLHLGDNVIGRYMKGVSINCAIETSDPSIDITHCILNVGLDKKGQLKYVLRDGPSNTGTFVDNEILGDRERRVLEDNSLFTIGATSIILLTADHKDS